MKKMHSLAYSVLAVSVMTIGAGSVLAQSSTAPAGDREETITSRDQDARVSMPAEEREGPSMIKPESGNAQNDMNNQRAGQSATTTSERNQSQMGTDRRATPDASQTGTDSRTTPNASQTAADRSKASMQNRGYLGSAPINGTQASDLMGAKVTTTGNEDVGPVSDLIIDSSGRVVAIVVGVGGFLGMGEKDVAIGWDEVTRSGTGDKRELRVNATREALKAAPKYERRN